MDRGPVGGPYPTLDFKSLKRIELKMNRKLSNSKSALRLNYESNYSLDLCLFHIK